MNSLNKSKLIFWERTFYDAFPTGDLVAADALSYEDNGPATIDMVFRCDWWSENMV